MGVPKMLIDLVYSSYYFVHFILNGIPATVCFVTGTDTGFE